MNEQLQNVRLYSRQPVDDVAEMPSVYAQKRFKPIHTLWAVIVSLLLQVIYFNPIRKSFCRIFTAVLVDKTFFYCTVHHISM